MRAIGMTKKWVEALDTNYSDDGITTLTDVQKALNKKNDDAWNYLVMVCNGKQSQWPSTLKEVQQRWMFKFVNIKKMGKKNGFLTVVLLP
jgi:hypothetical protein